MKCHRDLRPFGDLDEPTKELDRAHVRAVHGVYAEELARLRGEAKESEEESWLSGCVGRIPVRLAKKDIE